MTEPGPSAAPATEPPEPPEPDAALLSARGIVGGYGGNRVLDGVDLDVPDGGVLCLLGRNGVGKSTFVMSLLGLVPVAEGSARFAGTELIGLAPQRVARLGIGLVPQGRRVFAPLTVEENLRLAARGRDGAWTLERVYELFPRLAERRRNRGDRLSGGEQEMLAIGRALLTDPRLLLLDEPSDGLAPAIVTLVGDVIEQLTESGVSVLLVEQNVALALRVADRVAVLTKGRVSYRETAARVRADTGPLHALLGVG